MNTGRRDGRPRAPAISPRFSQRLPMHADQLRHCLDSVETARPLLQTWLVRDPERGWRNLTYLAGSLSPEALRELCGPLARLLPRCPDPDMALNSLERFLANPAARERLLGLLESRART